ncbi:MAG: hypothetical protein AABW56_02520 [Nanoarchaeota archaeon]
MLYTLMSFLGLILGYILASKVKEELDKGKIYFNAIIKVILVALIFVLAFKLYLIGFEFFIALVIGGILNYFIKKIYLFLGLSLILINDKLAASLLIFIFSLAYGTLEYIKYKKINYKSILMNFLLFLIPPILLFKKTMIFDNILTAFTMGGLIIYVFRFDKRTKKKKRA